MGGRLKQGHQAEQAAVDHLVALGWEIVARNVYFRCGELDVVARDGEYLVFVEVRSRSSEELIRAVDTVRPAKVQRVIAAAREFMRTRECRGVFARFDVIGVDARTMSVLDHVRAAFTAG